MMCFISIKNIDSTSYVVSSIDSFGLSDIADLNQTINSIGLYFACYQLCKHFIVDNLSRIDFWRPSKDGFMLFVHIRIRNERRVSSETYIVGEIGSEKFIRERELSLVITIHIDLWSWPKSSFKDSFIIRSQVNKGKLFSTLYRILLIHIGCSNHFETLSCIHFSHINRLQCEIRKTHLYVESVVIVENVKSRTMLIP